MSVQRISLTPKQEKVVNYLATRKGKQTSKVILGAVGGSYKALAADLKSLTTAKILRRTWSANGHEYLYTVRNTGLIAELDDPLPTAGHFKSLYNSLVGREGEYTPKTAKLAWKFPLGIAGLFNLAARTVTAGELITQTEIDRYREYLIEYRKAVIELYQVVNQAIEDSEAWAVSTAPEYLVGELDAGRLETLLQQTQLVIDRLTPQN